MKLITRRSEDSSLLKTGLSNAFTLAEVLITLAIIGVVAAMTMPTLMNNTNAVQWKTAYKKAMTVLSQAVVMNIALDDYDLEGTSTCDNYDSNSSTCASIASVARLFGDRLSGGYDSNVSAENYTVYIDNEGTAAATTAVTSSSLATSNYVYKFNDGLILFSFPRSAVNCTEDVPCRGWVDTNGTKGPNKTAYCSQTSNECSGPVTMSDIIPIKFYDQTIAPGSAAARAIMYGYENNSNGINGNNTTTTSP